jgi:hypothetical protein
VTMSNCEASAAIRFVSCTNALNKFYFWTCQKCSFLAEMMLSAPLFSVHSIQ